MDNHDRLFEMGARDVNSGPHVESSPETSVILLMVDDNV